MWITFKKNNQYLFEMTNYCCIISIRIYYNVITNENYTEYTIERSGGSRNYPRWWEGGVEGNLNVFIYLFILNRVVSYYLYKHIQ